MPKIESNTNSSPKQMAGWVSAFLFALFVLLVSTLMLICNSFFCYVVIGIIPLPQEQIVATVISQLSYFLIPVALTFLQWHLFDRLKRAFS